MDKTRDFHNEISNLKKLPYQIQNEIEKKFEELKLTFPQFIAKTIHKEFAAVINDLRKQKIFPEETDGARGISMKEEIEKLKEELEMEKVARQETLKRNEQLMIVANSYKEKVDRQNQKIQELMEHAAKISDSRTVEVVFGNDSSKFRESQKKIIDELKYENEVLIEKVVELEDKLEQKLMSSISPEKLKYFKSEYEKVVESCKIFERKYGELRVKHEETLEAYEKLLKTKDKQNKEVKPFDTVNEKVMQSLSDKLKHRESEIADMKVEKNSYITRIAELEQRIEYLEDIFNQTFS